VTAGETAFFSLEVLAMRWGWLLWALFGLVLSMLAGCEAPPPEDLGHHECPAPAASPAGCAEVAPVGFDPVARCLQHGSEVDSLWSGRMCSASGCAVEGYPPLQADFVAWYLCDGVPVELWCVSAEEGSQ
jgi:hypothetical protein